MRNLLGAFESAGRKIPRSCVMYSEIGANGCSSPFCEGGKVVRFFLLAGEVTGRESDP